MKRIIVLLLSVCLLLTGCGGKALSYEAEPEQTTELPSVTESAAAAVVPPTCGEPAPWRNGEVVDFSIRMLRESVEAGENTLLSPLSILAALSMTANGAEGETLAQMETVLGQSKDSLNAWYQYDADRRDGELHLANGVFIKDDPNLTVKDVFVKAVAQWYAADVVITDFNESTVEDINRYVEDNTHGMVKKVLREIPEDAVMYLVNALAFEARWDTPYNEYQVGESIFTTEDGRKQTVELMHTEEYDVYVEDELYTGFVKDYEGGRYVFLALLPREGVRVEEVAASLSQAEITDAVNSRWGGAVRTAIPKFRTEFDTEISEILKTMGMPDAFDPELADFSGLGTSSDGNIHISKVLHKTVISVGEQGTKAGAATVVEMADGCAIETEQVREVILDRPFLYMIWDMETNIPIFMGTLMDAQAEGTSVPADEPELCSYPTEGPCQLEG